MDVAKFLSPPGAPRWLRLGLIALLISGVFAMHNLSVADAEGSQSQDSTSSVSPAVLGVAAVTALDSDSTADASPFGSSSPGPISDCGGLLAWCMAMILGVSGLILLRRRQLDLILRKRPPRAALPSLSGIISAFEARSPLERAGVLRWC